MKIKGNWLNVFLLGCFLNIVFNVLQIVRLFLLSDTTQFTFANVVASFVVYAFIGIVTGVAAIKGIEVIKESNKN